jgi:hypothetical protein
MTANEPVAVAEEQPSRVAGGCMVVVAAAAAGGVVYAVPEVGYYVAGLLTAAGARKARTWVAGRRKDAEEQPETEEPVGIVAVLQELGADGEHVRLTQLQDAAGLPDTKAVRALLDEAGVPVRSGVRAGGKNGPGVHHDDIPQVEATCPPDCLCRSDANANTNNTDGEKPGEGFRVEHIGDSGTVITDPAKTRHHTTKT